MNTAGYSCVWNYDPAVTVSPANVNLWWEAAATVRSMSFAEQF